MTSFSKSHKPARGYYGTDVLPRSGIGRVNAALQQGLLGLEDVGNYLFDFKSGSLRLNQDGNSRVIARGFAGHKRSAFYLSFFGRVPSSAKGFLESQVLSFLRLRNSGVCVYDLFYLTHPDVPSERILGKLLYQGLAGYPFYLAISQYTKDVLCETYKVHPDKVHVIPLDCDRQTFRAREVDRRLFLSQWGIPPDRRLILHVSSGDNRKNVPRLLEAFGHVASLFPDAMLVRVGQFPRKENQLKEEAVVRRFELEGRMIHLRGLSDEDLAYFYNIAECFVFPSTAEGFGLPVLEAQSCGCPCVTSNTTALAEIAGPLCITVDPLDSLSIAAGIQSVLNDSDRRTRERDSNEKFLERFNWSVGQKLLRNWMETA